MQIMTDEQIKAYQPRVDKYRKSEKTEDQLVAILMDMGVGGFGMNEEPAKQKAKAIMDFMSEL